MTNWNDPHGGPHGGELDGEVEEELEELQPGDTDYDLSEEQPYSWEPKREPLIPPWLLVTITLLVIAALVVPSVLIVLQYR